MEKLLLTQDVAETLGMKKNTLEIWRIQGRGPKFVKVGHSVRYRREDVEAYVAGQIRGNTCTASR
jgi:excisionase family DNA binding protein